MIYAQIKDNKIINIIVLDNIDLDALFTENFDYCLRVCNINPIPQIGWDYDPDSNTYTTPPVEEE